MLTINPILLKIIEIDLKAKDISLYHLSDHVVGNVKDIQIKTHEVIYIYYCSVKSLNFELSIQSNSEQVQYTPLLMMENDSGSFQSNLISRHQGNVKLEPNTTGYDYQVKYLKISY